VRGRGEAGALALSGLAVVGGDNRDGGEGLPTGVGVVAAAGADSQERRGDAELGDRVDGMVVVAAGMGTYIALSEGFE
jgi:hypothetical protein